MNGWIILWLAVIYLLAGTELVKDQEDDNADDEF